jgi:hypothetical protein
MLEFTYIVLCILLVWLVGRTLVPAAIPRNKIKMVLVGFIGGVTGLLVGVVPRLQVGPEVGGVSALWTFLGVVLAIFWTGLDPLGRTRKRPG